MVDGVGRWELPQAGVVASHGEVASELPVSGAKARLCGSHRVPVSIEDAFGNSSGVTSFPKELLLGAVASQQRTHPVRGLIDGGDVDWWGKLLWRGDWWGWSHLGCVEGKVRVETVAVPPYFHHSLVVAMDGEVSVNMARVMEVAYWTH